MAKNTDLHKLTEATQRLSVITPRNDAELSLLGAMIGAAYGLRRAIRFGYEDRTGKNLPKGYKEELRAVSVALLSTDEVDEKPWLAGFYFNSALHRMSATNERLDKYIGGKLDVGSKVRREFNRMKHEVLGVIRGRSVSLRDALFAFSKLTTLMDLAFRAPSNLK